jgi:N-acetylglucosamine-6-sulfatase
VALVLSLAALAVVVPLAARGPGDGPGRPSIVLVLTDDQRFDSLWALPTVRRELIAQGVRFANAFVVNPVCCPSRASILTGRYSHSTGVYSNRGLHGGYESFEDGSTVATWLRAAGYRTGLFGKYLNGYRDTVHVPPGWDRWFALETDPSPFGYYYDWSAVVDGDPMHFGDAPADYSTDVLAREAAAFIRDTDGPLFVVYAPWAQHHVSDDIPAIPAPRHRDAFPNLPPYRPPSFNEPDVSDKPRYLRAIPPLAPSQVRAVDASRRADLQSLLAVDDGVATILDALRDTGRLGSTLIAFTSDNGIAYGEHRWTGKQAVYEEVIRVPLVIRYDPLTGGPRTVGALALNIDLAPTFARLAGVAPAGADGRSLLSLLQGVSGSWRADFLVEHLDEGEEGSPTFCAVRGRRYLYAVYEDGEQELYDLRADPFQLVNRADDPGLAAVRRALRERLRRLCDPPPPGFREELLEA